MPRKPWTKCSRGEEVVYVHNFAAFIRAHDLDKSNCYYARKSPNKRNVGGWSFERVVDVPEGATVWDGPITTQSTPAKPATDPELETTVDRFLAEEAGVDVKSLTPIQKFRELSNLIMDMSLQTAKGDGEYPVGWRPKDLTSVLDSYAKAWNIDSKKAMDARSDADKVVDSAEDILRDGVSVFEQVETVLNGLRTGFQQIHDNAEAYYDKLAGDGVRADNMLNMGDLLQLDPNANPEDPPGPKVIRRACQKWIDALREITEMADLARQPYQPGMSRREKIISESTHTLRYQLYVGRPDVNDPESKVLTYRFGQIHVRMSMRLWAMRVGANLDKTGIILPGELHPRGGYEQRPVKYDAFLGMLPPRHGKSDWVIHDAALNINKNPRIQMAVIHDKEGEASKILRATQNLFDIDTAQGRRNAVLYPGMSLEDYDNNKTTLRVRTSNPPRNPNFMAATVWGSGQGNNLDIIYGDDLVPQSDMTEHNKRHQRMVRFSGTWLTRLQGPAAHVVLTGYPRHHEDLMWSYYKAAQDYAKTGGKDGANIMALRLPVGGPNTDPPFKSIWPDMYPANELQRRYKRQNNALLWAANYMLQPMTDDQKIVRKVRLYDVDAESTAKALKGGEYHASVDPAAKGDGTGDNAGVIVASLVDVLRFEKTDEGDMMYEEKMLYVVHEDEFPATQTELTEHLVAMTSRWPIDTAHTEVVTGLGSAIKEALSTYYGVDRVVEHPVRNKGKAARLRSVAPVLENADAMIPAKVAFPGRRPTDDDGNPIPEAPLVPDPAYTRIISYIENFAVESGFHSLDALTQLCAYCVERGDLGVHEGEFSRQVNKSLPHQRWNQRRLERWKQVVEDHHNQAEDYAYFGDMNTPV
jgi:hypothetical protein